MSWRWCEWVSLIWSAVILAGLVLFQPETYGPELLRWKAKHLRRITGDDRYRAPIEVKSETFLDRLKRSLTRPFILGFQEPILMLITMYMTVVYIILFTFLNGYTFVFTMTYGFSEGITGLSFIGIGIGLFICTALVPIIYRRAKNEMREMEEKNGPGTARLTPEFRLIWAMYGAPAIPISMFWMGWTDYASVSYWSPLIASVMFGYGILSIFITSYQYVIDSYEQYSASALAMLTLVRYVAAGGMVEVAIPMVCLPSNAYFGWE